MSFTLSSGTRTQVRQNERTRQSLDSQSRSGAHTFVTHDTSPLGEDVLRTAVAYWKDRVQANGRVLIDKTGGRNHLFMGTSRPGFIGFSHLQLPEGEGNWAQIPHQPALAIAGDIDLRIYAALDPLDGASPALIAKGVPMTAPWAYLFSIDEATTALKFQWTVDGTNATVRTATSATVAELEDGNFRWLRVTREAATTEVNFYKSIDGVLWTLISTHLSLTGNIYSSGGDITIGGASGVPSAKGRIRRAVLFRGIEEDLPVLDATFSGRPDGTTSFTDLARFLLSPDRGLSLEGIQGEFAATLHVAGLNFTADADVQIKLALENWDPVTPQVLVSKWETSGQFSWKVAVEDGNVVWTWSTNGTSSSSTPLPFGALMVDGVTQWIRVTHDVSNAGQNIVTLWVSADGGNWQPVVSVPNAGTTSIFPGTSRVAVGAELNGAPSVFGNFLAVDIRDGIDGALIAAPRFYDVDSRTLSFTDEVDRVWAATDVRNPVSLVQQAVNGDEATIDDDGVQITPTGFAEAPHASALDIIDSGSVAIRLTYQAADWPPLLPELLIGKRALDVGISAGYQILANPDGTIEFKVADGLATSSVSVDADDYPESDLLVVARRDTDVGELHLDISDPVSGDTVSETAADGTTGSLANAVDLRVGALAAGGDAATFAMRGAAVWTRALSDAETSDLVVQMP